MLSVKLLVASFSLLAAVVTAQPPIFPLDCDTYPDVCDNHCNAAFCHGFDNPNAFLHYDPNSNSDMPNPGTQVTAATYRRNAIGCGGSNYCSGVGDCDEFPYASTYDGGLGCVVARYTGGDAIAQSGTTRCANPTQNSQHGNAIGQFYSNQSLGDGAQFQVGFDEDNIDNAPLCAALRGIDGTDACPDEDSGDYRFRSTPQSDFCPSRATRRRLDIPGLRLRESASRPGSSSFHTVKDAGGKSIIIIHGPRPAPGTKVWRMTADGRGAQSTVVG